MSQAFQCDECGKLQEGSSEETFFEEMDDIEIEITLEPLNNRASSDLCLECIGKLLVKLADKLGKEDKEIPIVEEKEKPKKKKASKKTSIGTDGQVLNVTGSSVGGFATVNPSFATVGFADISPTFVELLTEEMKKEMKKNLKKDVK